jgi:transposase-like protein
VQTGVGPVPLAVPRDRAGSSGPVLVPKRAGRIAGGLDDMIISLYALVILSFRVSRGCDLRRPVVDSVGDGTLAA